jgi:hypothetical protein
MARAAWVESTIDRILNERDRLLLGKARESCWDDSLLLVAYAICTEVEDPGEVWEIYYAAFEDCKAEDAISEARVAVANGTYEKSKTFDITSPTWVLYVAHERSPEGGRCLAVEVGDTADPWLQDVLLAAHKLPVFPKIRPDARMWTVDLKAFTCEQPVKDREKDAALIGLFKSAEIRGWLGARLRRGAGKKKPNSGASPSTGSQKPKVSGREALVCVWVLTLGSAALLGLTDLLVWGDIGVVRTFLWPWGRGWGEGVVWQLTLVLAVWVTIRVVSGRWDAKK